MAVIRNDNGNGYKIRCLNPRRKKMTTIRRNPKTGLNFQTKREAKKYEQYYLKNQVNLSLKFDSLFRHYIDDYMAQKFLPQQKMLNHGIEIIFNRLLEKEKYLL